MRSLSCVGLYTVPEKLYIYRSDQKITLATRRKSLKLIGDLHSFLKLQKYTDVQKCTNVHSETFYNQKKTLHFIFIG